METSSFASNFLFAKPSFVEGFVRCLDVGGTLNTYNTSASTMQADAIAMYQDWAAVGEDILLAAWGIGNQLNSQPTLF